MSTNKLRLGPLPKAETIKLTISLSTNLKTMLDRYAALHAQAYGESVDGVALIPHMLEAFMVRDREFKKYLAKAGSATHPKPVPGT
ncbi:DUF2274 domain-containing protein [Thiobacillus sp.]|uniref:DUF2274 domain-containing protein n=1 Tax=Thiobacillus sp. TaxID=924 RepID=UPI001AC01AE3|nr:DUF2274 domain-containing protein [Thiobacillus sp.]MBN8779918.1 DUF2274 domain-containing protein [Thiobacillus sp.]